MPKIEVTRAVNHSGENMFDLVVDVERYPEFLPSCQSLTLQSSETREDYKIHTAYMTVGTKRINHGFASRVTEHRESLKINVHALDGPFKYMESQWRFESSEQGCTIHFSIEYEFKSKTLSLLVGSMFDKMFRSTVTAFESRADSLYK